MRHLEIGLSVMFGYNHVFYIQWLKNFNVCVCGASFMKILLYYLITIFFPIQRHYSVQPCLILIYNHKKSIPVAISWYSIPPFIAIYIYMLLQFPTVFSVVSSQGKEFHLFIYSKHIIC